MKRPVARRLTAFLVIGALLGAARASWADSLDAIANKLAKGTATLSSHKIAVLAFTYPDGSISTGSSLVAEGLTTRLVGRKGISVIERSQLSKLLSETKLELSGVTVSSGTQKVGKILGVDAVVTGTLVDLPNKTTMINARLVGSETGEVLAAATRDIDRTWEDAPHQPTTEIATPEGEVRYMSPLIPVSRGPYAGGGPPAARPRHHTFSSDY